MFVAASTHCFSDLEFFEACGQIVDLEYDKIEIWLSEASDHLKPSVAAADPELFAARYRERTRLAPVAFAVQEDVEPGVLAGLAKLAKLLRVTQITVPASPLGTPFNIEIDRLRTFQQIAAADGVRLSIKTRIGDLTEDPHTAVELCQSVRGLGLTLDPSHYLTGPNRGQSFDQVFPHVYHVHLRDSTADQVQVQVGLGEIDYSRLIQNLERAGYKGALAVEILPELAGDLDRGLELRKLRMLLESLL